MHDSAPLNPLSEFSSVIGKDPSLIQGPGGNTSIKLDGQLWIKASGMWLADALDKNVFCCIGLDVLAEALADDDDGGRIEAAIAAASGELRPSIETSLHALLPHRVVVHVHSVEALFWLVQPDLRAEAAQKLDGIRCAWIPYRRPGAPLTLAVRAALDDNPDVLLLANHGIVVGADDVRAAGALLDEVVGRLAVEARRLAEDAFTAGDLRDVCERLSLRPARNGPLQSLARDPVSLGLLKAGVLYPDQAVYLGPDMVTDESLSTKDLATDYLIVPGRGVAIRDGANAAVAEMLDGHALLLQRLGEDANLQALSQRDIGALLNWDAEAYRQNLDAGR